MFNDRFLFKKVMREITPLGAHDCFSIFSRRKRSFSFPLHSHEEMELNLIIGGKGIQRIVGDHIGHIADVELVLIGPNLPHGWFTERDHDEDVLEVTVQFHKDLFSQNFLEKDQLRSIRKLLELAGRGLAFAPQVATQVKQRIIDLEKLSGFDSFIQLLSLLHDLSTARNNTLLSDATFSRGTVTHESQRLEKAFEFMTRRYGSQIGLSEIARIVNMSEASFSRFIKAQTGFTFTENLMEIRLGNVTRMLISTQLTIAEIAYHCGFNNMANFNKLFKRRKGCTPKEFKMNYNRQLVLV
ncbi:AraC family transcriptional regulator [Chitinophaga sp. Cy-1792]|uniref:AraC family transcriptional regulator n=1 Tax=Chitinophaga sp. Cy-1792 TaxID=2608339 RepID=UPI0014243EBF|nr:AraC family transcriptional regulator [Chitinophaga sp. Cy-1792]NIG56709.1 helix-turn-helix transcriptional regulator [Chitinophaga sp. Cy-1792]